MDRFFVEPGSESGVELGVESSLESTVEARRAPDVPPPTAFDSPPRPSPPDESAAPAPQSPPVGPSRQQLWKAAVKLPMYTVAVVPIWVGTAVALFETRALDWRAFLTFLFAAIAIVAWLNLSNDAFDAETGIDANKAHSVVNLTGNRTLVLWLANGFLLAGIAGILAIALWQGDWTVLGLVVLCCFLGYTYQGPPFRLGYLGLGEPICFVCFGPLAIAAAYYSQTQSWSWLALAASLAIGATTTLILFCSHFHQVEDDRAAGKTSPVARLGTARSARLLPWTCGLTFGAIAAFAALGWFPLWTLATLASAPVAWNLCRHVGENHDRPAAVSNCKFIAVSLHFWSGLLLGAGFALGAIV